MLAYHAVPQPVTCDVCKYALDHSYDCAYEHARVRVATAWLLDDLEQIEGESAALIGLAVSHVGVEPGPVHPIDPRHRFWAILHEPDIRLSYRRAA